jgi:hypothetical protein
MQGEEAMSVAFPTWNQFAERKREQLRAEYPEAYTNEPEAFEDTVRLHVSEDAWMTLLPEMTCVPNPCSPSFIWTTMASGALR